MLAPRQPAPELADLTALFGGCVANLDSAGPVVGRPRRFDDETERGMLIDAAVRVMGAHKDASMSLDEILAEAGLSTRAFYRHFGSKEELLETLTLREAAAFGRSLERAVNQASDPVAAVKAWLKRFLDAFYEPRRAERTIMLTAAAYKASRPSAQMTRAMQDIACAPLVRALRAGHEAGVLYSPTPEADASSIHALATVHIDVQSILEVPAAGGVSGSDREATQAHVERYAWPALRLSERA